MSASVCLPTDASVLRTKRRPVGVSRKCSCEATVQAGPPTPAPAPQHLLYLVLLGSKRMAHLALQRAQPASSPRGLRRRSTASVSASARRQPLGRERVHERLGGEEQAKHVLLLLLGAEIGLVPARVPTAAPHTQRRLPRKNRTRRGNTALPPHAEVRQCNQSRCIAHYRSRGRRCTHCWWNRHVPSRPKMCRLKIMATTPSHD